MVASPIAWPTIQAGLYTWVVGATELPAENVRWAAQSEHHQPSMPFATIDLVRVSSPGLEERRRDSQVMRDVVTVTSTAESNYSMSIAIGVDDPVVYSYEAQIGDDEGDIRDGLFDAYALNPISGIACSKVDVDSVQLDGSSSTPAFHTVVGSGLDRETVTNAILETSAGLRELTVEINVHSSDAKPDAHAFSLGARLDASLGLTSVLEALSAAGLGYLRTLSDLDTSYLDGARWVKRVTKEYVFSIASNLSEDVDWYRTAEAQTSFTE